MIPNDIRFVSKEFSQKDFPLADNGPFLCVHKTMRTLMNITNIIIAAISGVCEAHKRDRVYHLPFSKRDYFDSFLHPQT